MRIDLGNFGNNQRTAASTQVNRGDVTAIADAKINAARNQLQTAQQVGQAYGQLANQMTRTGEQIEQRNQQAAAAQGALAMQQRELHQQGVMQEAQDKIDAGELKSADVHKFIADGMAKFEIPDIPGMWGNAQKQFEKGLAMQDTRMQSNTDHLYRAAHKVESRATVDEMISNNERLTLNGGNLEKAAALYDTDGFKAMAREGYGAGFQQKIIQAKGQLYRNSALNEVMSNRDSYSGLASLQKQITDENGKYYGKLSAEDQLQITGQIDSRKGTLEAKAEAAQARAEAQAARAENRRIAADNHAQSAVEHAQLFIAGGGVPDDNYIEQLNQQTAGTSYAGAGTQLMKQATQTQAFLRLPLAEQETRLATLQPTMNGSPEAKQQFNALSNAHEQVKKSLITDPVLHVAQASGVQVAPLPWDAIRQAKTPEDMKAANQQFAAAVYSRDALNKQARQQSRDVPIVRMTAQERTDMKAYADSLQPSQRTEFYKTVANAGGRMGLDLVKEISGSDVVTAAAYHQAANPHANTGNYIAAGNDMLNDPKGNYKAPKNKDTQSAIDDAYAGAIPARKRNTIANSVNAYYVKMRADAGQDPNQFSSDDYTKAMHAVIGEPIKYGKSTVVVPADTDAGGFRNTVYNQITQLPGGANAIASLETGKANLVATGAKSYMLTTPSGAPFYDPQSGQAIKIEIP